MAPMALIVQCEQASTFARRYVHALPSMAEKNGDGGNSSKNCNELAETAEEMEFSDKQRC